MKARTLLSVALLPLFGVPAPRQSVDYEFRKVRVETVQKNGSARNCVDITFVGDGYIAEDLVKGGAYERDIGRAVKALFDVEPFRAERKLFNVHAVFAQSFDRGAEDRAGEDKKRTILDCSFDSPTGRLLVYQRAENVMRLAKLAPATDIVLVMINDPRYGGSGGVIWEHTPAPCFSSEPASIQIAVHELGHSMANLGDEYADPGEVDRRPLPQGTQDFEHANLTLAAFIDVTSPKTIAATAKWKHFFELPGAPGPIGAFEGGYYRDGGVFRPEERCKMRASADPFCHVCREALAQSIQEIVGRKFDHSAYHAANPIVPEGK